ncbi:hypothetical protein MKK84_31780, partial [Methylobacterium sp. E-065]|uniref:hypothetical protein n=1 Tax=Methylobacterium sp. E-065 TaxID=2836583 RepID=UPI001FB9785E
GGLVGVTNAGAILTGGSNASGIQAQSIGGGGGGGDELSSAATAPNNTSRQRGGGGGRSSPGGAVTIINAAARNINDAGARDRRLVACTHGGCVAVTRNSA